MKLTDLLKESLEEQAQQLNEIETEVWKQVLAILLPIVGLGWQLKNFQAVKDINKQIKILRSIMGNSKYKDFVKKDPKGAYTERQIEKILQMQDKPGIGIDKIGQGKSVPSLPKFSPNESNIMELSPLAKNLAALAAATKHDDDKDVPKLLKTKYARDYKALTELPKPLQDRGKSLAEEVQKSLFPDIEGTTLNYELKKVIPSMDNAKITPPFIRYKIVVLDKEKRKQYSLLYIIYKDKFEEGRDNIDLNSNLNSRVLKFVNDLKKELQ